MTTETHTRTIEVKITYPSAHHPAEGRFSPETTVGQIKKFALDEFHLKEETVDGNQIVFFLFHGKEKLENMNEEISTLLKNPHQDDLEFRLAKEVIAG